MELEINEKHIQNIYIDILLLLYIYNYEYG